MGIARLSIDRPIYTWILMVFLLFGGTWGFLTLGRLEDPAFTIKTAAIVTQYPGASAAQVAREVSEPLESAIQKMGEVDRVESENMPGLSVIEVEIKETIPGPELPDVWTRLRAEVRDATPQLPIGASEPYVNDGFGDVFGIYLAVSMEGFEDREKHDVARFLRREILTVDGVSDVTVAGLPEEAIFVEPDLARSANLNLPPLAVIGAIANANSITPVGEEDGMRIQTAEGSDSVQDISGLTIGVAGEIVRIVDMAGVSRGRVEHPELLIRHNGAEAFTIGIAGIQTENIVDVGKRVDAKLASLEPALPIGVDIAPIYQQHLIVETASNDFLVNLTMSVAIVVLVLALFMGWRAAIVVGGSLLVTVVGTLLCMKLGSIQMERISLGALIIAMGMLVDNAIVIAEGMQTAMRRGKSSRDAAEEAAQKTQIPLLGATFIAIMAFAAIGLSSDTTGEFLFSLFAVIATSLTLSWIVALTITPLLGHYFFVTSKETGVDPYGGALFRGYALLLRGAIRTRWLVVLGLIGATFAAFANFGNMRDEFFPDSNTPLLYVHYKLPQGAQIQETAAHLQILEEWLAQRDDVAAITTFAGDGAARFMLTYPVQSANPSYGHIIIRLNALDDMPALQAELDRVGPDLVPDGEFRTRRLAFGPGGGDPIQLRISGQDPQVLRELSVEAMRRMEASTDAFTGLRTDWREQELTLVPEYATNRAQTAGITREIVADSLRFATDGLTAGVYRENERQIPIIVRAPRDTGTPLTDYLTYAEGQAEPVPLGQVIDGFKFDVQDTLMMRRDRVPTITVSGDIYRSYSASDVHADIRTSIEAMELPPGYAIAWGGEYEDTQDAQAGLSSQLPTALILMVTISVLLFNALRQPLIIWLLVPMSVVGVVPALIAVDLPFSFTALLGLLSLSGMLIKNGIVLVEEIDLVRETGQPFEDAVVLASVSRLRPVVLAAATTILGMIPLLFDVFFVSMAVTIMAGLAFATALTMIAAPVFYHIFFSREAARLARDTPEPQPA